MDEHIRRVAYNQTIFRAGNEALSRNADSSRPTIPFMCECADETCLGAVPLSREQYEDVRRHPRRFLVVPGHEERGDDSFEVVGRSDDATVIEKVDAAGEIANAQDPRSESR